MNIYISFFVGGVLLMSLIFLQVNMSQNSVDTTFATISSKQVESLGGLLDHDFRKMGMGNTGSGTSIQSADSNAITFVADLDKDLVAEVVTWKYDNTGISPAETPNPNDYSFIRSVNSQVDTLAAVVTRFRLNYRMSDGTMNPSPSAAQLEEISTIYVEMICESPAPVNGSAYAKSTWRKVFTPANLQF